ncbi:MAG: hypothetical protein DSZ32_00210 [Gammaproteobacteria bacterium]|nr:MAG: hypothetical protein DSZ32_00210 [Gammaproteobacteria bacterium]
MTYLKDASIVMDADDAGDAETASAVLEAEIANIQEQLTQLPANYEPRQRALLLLDMADALLTLDRKEDAWGAAREAFDLFLADEDWDRAVQSCNILFGADQPESLAALGQGVWLAVTYPITADLSVAMLEHIVDETPDEADGAAVAAAAAHYLVDLRTEGKDKDNLGFYTSRLMADVARRHSNVDSQEAFDLWVEKLELNDPAKFLVRLRNVIDVLVQEDWWFDREELQSRLPVN